MKKKILLLFILFGAFLFFSVPASAVLFELDTTYSGAEPSGALLARIDNVSPIDVIPPPFGVKSQVRLTMDTGGLSGSEKVGAWLFNFSSDVILDTLDFRFNEDKSTPGIVGSLISAAWTPDHSKNEYKAGPAHDFDIEFLFNTSDGDNFGPSMKVVFDIFSVTAPFDPSYFYDVNTTGAGPFLSAAHVQGIPTGAGSGWVADDPNPVPEPATMLLVGIGLVGLAGFGRRRFKA